jgi:S-adenosylmethionine:tRNA ribosyltransferase-isomerase
VIRLEDLDYSLPPERIASRPVRPRDASRLLLLERASGRLEDLRFADLASRARPADLFVVNDTRVVPAKLRGRKPSGGRAEVLLLERGPDATWRALVRTRGRLRPGLALRFEGLEAEVVSVETEGACRLRFAAPQAALETRLARIGEAPLPPYIPRPAPCKQDLEDYQTIFARAPGAVAAPTAGLHFTPELAARLRLASVTLHVGPGTFRPLRRIAGHRLDPERFEIPAETERAIEAAHAEGGRVNAVGTTVVRALETTRGCAGRGEADLLILPGHRFRAVDALVTNFHLPRSSLLALVMAFAGVEPVRRAYAHAIEAGYRFYSYGDAMWIT